MQKTYTFLVFEQEYSYIVKYRILVKYYSHFKNICVLEGDTMVESPVSKESIALSIINVGLAKSKNPCICFSGGINSLALLRMIKMQDPGRLSVIHADHGSEFFEVQSYIRKMQKLWKFNLIVVKSVDLPEDVFDKKPCTCKSRTV